MSTKFKKSSQSFVIFQHMYSTVTLINNAIIIIYLHFDLKKKKKNIPLTLTMQNSDSWLWSCVWYNASYNYDKTNQLSDEWSDFDCFGKVNFKQNQEISITCGCNHLTTFAILMQLEDYQINNDNDFFHQYSENYIIYLVILSTFDSLFFAVAAYVVRLFYTLKFKYDIQVMFGITCLCTKNKENKKKNSSCEPAFAILFFTFVQAIVQTLSCLLFLMFAIILPNFDTGFDNFSDSKLIHKLFQEMLTFGLFLPMIVSFYIYSCVVYSLSIVSHSLMPRIESIQKKTFKFTIFANICVTLFLVVAAFCMIFIPSVSLIESKLFLVRELLYLVLLSITLILASYFTYGARKVLIDTMKFFKKSDLDGGMQKNENDFIKRKKALYKILLSSFVLRIMLFVQIISLVIWVIKPYLFHPAMQMVEILFHWVYLMFVLCFYNSYFEAKIKDKILIEQSYVLCMCDHNNLKL